MPSGFAPGKITMGTSEASRLCPAGWVGALWLGLSPAGAGAIVTAPDDTTLALVRERLAGVAPADVADVRVWAPRWPHGAGAGESGPGGAGPGDAGPGGAGRGTPPGGDDVRGPWTLAYLDPDDFHARPSDEVVAAPMAEAADELGALEGDTGPDEAAVAGLRYANSPLFVVRRGGRIAAACGYNPWRDSFAHVMVLTHPAYRRRGLATAVASAASADAPAAAPPPGLVPQWRASADPSRTVAATLGYAQAGGQISVRVG
jgi:hypothetical protein